MRPSNVAELKMVLDFASVRIQCALDQTALGRSPALETVADGLRQAMTAIEIAQAHSFEITPAQMRELWELTQEIRSSMSVLLLASGAFPSNEASVSH